MSDHEESATEQRSHAKAQGHKGRDGLRCQKDRKLRTEAPARAPRNPDSAALPGTRISQNEFPDRIVDAEIIPLKSVLIRRIRFDPWPLFAGGNVRKRINFDSFDTEAMD
jgi:hypothetical protein